MSKKPETKEVVAKKENAVMANGANFDESALDVFAQTGLCAGDDVDMNDVFIPKVQLCQSNSDCVVDEKAIIGDYVNSVSLDGLGKEVGIFVLKVEKYYQIFEVINEDGKITQEYVEKVPRFGNVNLPKTETLEDGKEIIRTKLTTMFCLLEKDIKEGTPKIYQIDFRKTSFGTGMELMSAFDDLAKMRLPNGKVGVPSYAKCFVIGSAKKKNPDNKPYLIKAISSTRFASSAEINVMLDFASSLNEYLQNKQEDLSDVVSSEDGNGVVNNDVVDTVSREINGDIPF